MNSLFIKTGYVFLSLLLLAFIGCEDSIPAELEISQSSFNASNDYSTFPIEITSNSTWTLYNNFSWCLPDKTQGKGDGTLKITVTPNLTSSVRTAELILRSGDVSQNIRIVQDAATEEYAYKLPVVFQVLYKDKNNRQQYIDKGWLPTLLEACNQLFKKSIDMNLQFVLATETPEGEKMEEPGVNRVYWDTPEMNCEDFMNGKYSTYATPVWDLTRYINVVIYTFTENTTLGITHLPYTCQADSLAGLYAGDYYFTHPATAYPHCVSINNSAIYNVPPQGYYTTSNIIVTLTHELGHYLGLYHVFSEKDCSETDFCEDTPNYNRKEYTTWLNNYLEDMDKTANNPNFYTMVNRTSCEGKSFISRNLMDYAICHSNQFTTGQRKRVRHVLEHSPLMPGPKFEHPQSRNAEFAAIPPFRFIK